MTTVAGISLRKKTYLIGVLLRPATLSAMALVIGIALNFLLIGTLQYRGLALTTSISTTLSFVFLLIALQRKIGALGLRRELIMFGKITLASTAMGAYIWFCVHNSPILTGNYQQCFLWTVLITGGSILFYAALLFILRVETIYPVLGWLEKLIKLGFHHDSAE